MANTMTRTATCPLFLLGDGLLAFLPCELSTEETTILLQILQLLPLIMIALLLLLHSGIGLENVIVLGSSGIGHCALAPILYLHKLLQHIQAEFPAHPQLYHPATLQ